MLRTREELLAQIDQLEADKVELKDVIREGLTVLHKTNVSKKRVADRMRAAIGLLPGEPVRRR